MHKLVCRCQRKDRTQFTEAGMAEKIKEESRIFYFGLVLIQNCFVENIFLNMLNI